MAHKDNDLIVIGKIASPYGIKGWVKVNSFTESLDNILHYQPWYLRQNNGLKRVNVTEGRIHGKAVVVHIESVDDRDSAELLKGCEIAVQREQLPAAQPGEYYWIDLIGLQVINLQGVGLGRVDHLLETGANDVLVLKDTNKEPPDKEKGDSERLIPFVRGEIVKEVDLENGKIHVDWDEDF